MAKIEDLGLCANPRSPGHGSRAHQDMAFVFLGQQRGRKDVLLRSNVVGHDDRGENREALACVQSCIKTMRVYARDFNFLARPCGVNQVVGQNTLFPTRHATSGDAARAFLDGHALIVAINCFLVVNLKMRTWGHNGQPLTDLFRQLLVTPPQTGPRTGSQDSLECEVLLDL